MKYQKTEEFQKAACTDADARQAMGSVLPFVIRLDIRQTSTLYPLLMQLWNQKYEGTNTALKALRGNLIYEKHNSDPQLVMTTTSSMWTFPRVLVCWS